MQYSYGNAFILSTIHLLLSRDIHSFWDGFENIVSFPPFFLMIYIWLIGKLEIPSLKPKKMNENGTNSTAIPGRIGFLEELSDIFVRLFPDLWKLGQAYFGGELFVRVDPSKREEFKVFCFFYLEF